MTLVTSTDLTTRSRSRSKGFIRTAFDRLFEVRDSTIRRHAGSILSIHGSDRFDLSEMERRSLFDMTGPERR